ncbi:hypothetical protein EJ08DRAFT_592209 [Tothia fuscella]|uniref:Uncharacterized protein n=1 Tax=Tothia fuscella TaxID=1048955 RepID=A0A9P4TX72_9PEZI|nr:hypothetical protein EJ08DRAFT_592209 [Tothia fuscella]
MALRTRNCIKLLCLSTTAFILFLLALRERLGGERIWATDDWKGHPHLQLKEDKLVPLEAHIMSKCPDALACLQRLIVPTMELTASKVNFTLSYIGSADPSDPDGVLCKHGPSECLGNIIELCAANLYPDPKINLGFTLCLSKKYEDIPSRELIEGCALEHGMDFAKLNDCASKEDGGFGMELLRRSVVYSRGVNASVSCTVRLDGRERCVRDGGVWKDCSGGSSVKSLVKDVEERWKEINVL